jgi:hypothetical protein
VFRGTLSQPKRDQKTDNPRRPVCGPELFPDARCRVVTVADPVLDPDRPICRRRCGQKLHVSRWLRESRRHRLRRDGLRRLPRVSGHGHGMPLPTAPRVYCRHAHPRFPRPTVEPVQNPRRLPRVSHDLVPLEPLPGSTHCHTHGKNRADRHQNSAKTDRSHGFKCANHRPQIKLQSVFPGIAQN